MGSVKDCAGSKVRATVERLEVQHHVSKRRGGVLKEEWNKNPGAIRLLNIYQWRYLNLPTCKTAVIA